MKKKIILPFLLFVMLAVPAAWLQLQDGVMMDGRFFVQRNADLYVHGTDTVSIDRADDGAQISLTLDGGQLEVDLKIENDRYSFAYEDGRTVEGYAETQNGELVDADGAPIWMADSIVVVFSNEPEPSVLTREYTLSNILYHMVQGICEQRGHVLVILMALLIYALGVASFFWPEEVHFFGGRWMYANAELSDAGITVQKISGVACAAAAIVLLFAPLFW